MAVLLNSRIGPLETTPGVKTGELHNLHSYPHLLSATHGPLMVKTINCLIFLPPKVTHSSQLFTAVVSTIVQISVKVVFQFVSFSVRFYRLYFDNLVTASSQFR